MPGAQWAIVRSSAHLVRERQARRAVAALSVLSNNLQAVRIKGVDLKAWLEVVVKQFAVHHGLDAHHMMQEASDHRTMPWLRMQ